MDHELAINVNTGILTLLATLLIYIGKMYERRFNRMETKLNAVCMAVLYISANCTECSGKEMPQWVGKVLQEVANGQ